MTLKQWKPKQINKAVTVIGAAIVDVLANGASRDVFDKGSQPMESIRISFGGDALNEAVALAKLGISVELLSKVGCDEAGERVLEYLKKHNVDAEAVTREAGLDTGVNIVLIDEEGERHFLTNPKGSLRKLTKEDILPHLGETTDIVSFASIFVSPLLDIDAMEEIFREIKEKAGRILVADMTKPKNGECLEDVAGLLSYVDFFLPNEEEVAMLTGEQDVYRNAELLVKAGVRCVVIKRGEKGCLIRTGEECLEIPAYPVAKVVDTTGAGDCFAAGFIWGMHKGLSIEECGRFACAVASCAVEAVGATEGIEDMETIMNRYVVWKSEEE